MDLATPDKVSIMVLDICRVEFWGDRGVDNTFKELHLLVRED